MWASVELVNQIGTQTSDGNRLFSMSTLGGDSVVSDWLSSRALKRNTENTPGATDGSTVDIKNQADGRMPIGGSVDPELDIVKSDTVDVYFDMVGDSDVYTLEPHKFTIPMDRKRPVPYSTAVLNAAEILLHEVRNTAADPSQIDDVLAELSITRLVNGRIVRQFGGDKPVYEVTDGNGRTAVVKFINYLRWPDLGEHHDELRITRFISELPGVSSVKLLDSTMNVDGGWTTRFSAAKANWDMLVMQKYEYSLDEWMTQRGLKPALGLSPEQRVRNQYMGHLAGAHMLCEVLMVMSQVDDFAHNDLHMSNILLDIPTDYEYHRYHLKEGIVITVPVAPFEGRRFVLFDYGLSRLKYTTRRSKKVSIGDWPDIETNEGSMKVWSTVMRAPLELYSPGIRGKSRFEVCRWMTEYALSIVNNLQPSVGPNESSRVLDIRFS